jgi:putative ABC transport system permease protein
VITMLSNNNQVVIKNLAKASLVHNRRRYLVMFLAILLSAFMLFSVLTVGATYFKMWRIQNLRLNGAEFDAIMYSATDAQLEKLKSNADITDVGVLAIAGFIDGSEKNDMADTSLVWVDDTYWNKMQAPAKKYVKGHYPEKKNEVMVTPKALEECGIRDYGIGDSFRVKWTDTQSVQHNLDFTICGIWDGYGPRNMLYVSKSFYDTSGWSLDSVSSGRIMMNFRQKIMTTAQQNAFTTSMNLSKKQKIFFMTELGNSLPLYLGLLALLLVTCVCAYLLIYNIMYLSVTGNIRYYGLLQTVGMTGRQIYRLIYRQMLIVGAGGIVLGIAGGCGISFFVIPSLVKAFGIRDKVQVVFHPVIFVLTILLVVATIYIGSRKPAKIAVTVSPIEAIRYQTKTQGRKKKTIISILSLAAGLSVFVCVITLLRSQGPRTIVSSAWNDDLEISNRILSKDNAKWREIVDDDFLQKLADTEGVQEVHTITTAQAMVPWEPEFADMWMREFYEMWMEISYEDEKKEYQEHPENFGTVLVGIDNKNFEILNESLEQPIDAKAFQQGKTCVIYRDGLAVKDRDLIGKTVYAAELGNGNHAFSFEIAGVTDDSTMTGPIAGYPPTIIISQDALAALHLDTYIYKTCVYYNKAYDTATQSRVEQIVADSKDARCMKMVSKIESMEELKAAQGNMTGVGIGISLILAVIGVMNYINTIIGNIANRRKELAILESIGMTRKQMNHMFMREGSAYALGSILVTIVVGLPITWGLYQSMNYMNVPFFLPIGPISIVVFLLLVICVGAPLISLNAMCKTGSVVERIRQSDE